MNEASFTISSVSQSVKIDPVHIFGSHDALYAYLNVPVNFTLRNLSEDKAFDLLPVNGQLSFQQPAQFLSETIAPWGTSAMGRESNPGYVLKFKLEEQALHFIEKNRKADLQMLLEFNIHTLIKSTFKNPTGGRSFSSDFLHSETTKLNFQIPRSVWVEKILPELGYRNLKLIEIPLSHDHLKEAYQDIILEFNKAEHYFNMHDYNKCVAHCRHTLDALTRNLRSIKNESKSETGFKWLQTVSTETFTWLDKLNQSTSALTSKTHHSGQTVDFSRHEAESIYLILLGLLNYIGNLVS